MSTPQATRGRLVGFSGDRQAFRFTVKSSKERKRLSLEQRVLDLEEVVDQLIQVQATRDPDFPTTVIGRDAMTLTRQSRSHKNHQPGRVHGC